jgi:bacterioferritin-associated ferredoxin
MYVCLCNGYTDRQIRSTAAGCTTVSDVYRALGSPPRCGKCVSMVVDLCRDTGADASPCGGGDDD